MFVIDGRIKGVAATHISANGPCADHLNLLSVVPVLAVAHLPQGVAKTYICPLVPPIAQQQPSAVVHMGQQGKKRRSAAETPDTADPAQSAKRQAVQKGTAPHRASPAVQAACQKALSASAHSRARNTGAADEQAAAKAAPSGALKPISAAKGKAASATAAAGKVQMAAGKAGTSAAAPSKHAAPAAKAAAAASHRRPDTTAYPNIKARGDGKFQVFLCSQGLKYLHGKSLLGCPTNMPYQQMQRLRWQSVQHVRFVSFVCCTDRAVF